jgi:hypothetical protein
MPEKLTGSCLCRASQYRINGEIRMAGNCHCNKCKKITGGPFQSFALVREEDFEFIQGEESLSTYHVSDNLAKHFCPACGTALFNRNKMVPGKLIVQIGTLDTPAAVTPAYNLHCENMLPWITSIGQIRSFEKGYEK